MMRAAIAAGTEAATMTVVGHRRVANSARDSATAMVTTAKPESGMALGKDNAAYGIRQ